MSGKTTALQECVKRNALRRVSTEKVDHMTYFRNIRGNLLISGRKAGSAELLADLAECCCQRGDLPTILLTSRMELVEKLEQKRRDGRMKGAVISKPGSKDYHPMYGMSEQQIGRLAAAAGEDLGFRLLCDQIVLYLQAVMNVVSTRYPVSFQAIYQLLRKDDDYIAALAEEEGAPWEIREQLLSSREAGCAARRIWEYLRETFGEISEVSGDTGYSLQSGAGRRVPLMVFWQSSVNQRVLNRYLKEEICGALQYTGTIRVILDETVFLNEQDELLSCLLDMKRQGRIELMAVSQNALEMFWGKQLDFENVCLFRHASETAFENLSRAVFGTFPYHYAMKQVGKPPSLLFTLRTDERWEIEREERLRICSADLLSEYRLFGTEGEKLAVSTGNGRVYLVPVQDFMACGTGRHAVAVRR